jgi:hypothetical protein
MLFLSFHWQLLTGNWQLGLAATIVAVCLFWLLLIAALAAAHPPVAAAAPLRCA